MDNYYQHNLAIISKRWPALAAKLQAVNPELDSVTVLEGNESTLLINGVQLSSRHNRLAEAQLQAAKIDEAQPTIHLYGPGLGDLPQLLLQRTTLKKLHVHIMNEHIFILVLQLTDQSSWLNSPKVTLQFAADHPDIQQPFIASPAEVELSSVLNHKIKMRILLAEEVTYFNENIQQHISQHEHRVTDNKAFWQGDAKVQQLYNSIGAEREAFVIATGPSLEQNLAYIKQRAQSNNHRPLLIAVDTAVKPLLSQQIIPDIVVTIDTKITKEIVLYDQLPDSVTLVYSPLTQTDLLAHWAGKRYVAMVASESLSPIKQQLAADQLYVHGSVIHPATDLAVKMGSRQIVLFGADFAYYNNKTHALWQDGLLGPAYQHFNAGEWTVNALGEHVKTLRNFQNYLIGLERYISNVKGVRFYNSAKTGSVIQGTQYYPELFPC